MTAADDLARQAAQIVIGVAGGQLLDFWSNIGEAGRAAWRRVAGLSIAVGASDDAAGCAVYCALSSDLDPDCSWANVRRWAAAEHGSTWAKRLRADYVRLGVWLRDRTKETGMTIEKTFAMIKPDATAAGRIGDILTRIEQEGFRIVHMRIETLAREAVDGFYAEHLHRDFYPAMREFIASGPSVLLVLEREDAVSHWRTVIGPTDPVKAYAAGGTPTLRALFGDRKGPMFHNAVHGSDGPESAAHEIAYFFGAPYPVYHRSVRALLNEILGSRSNFPGNRRMLAALVEEVGELAEALASSESSPLTREQRVQREAIQVAATAIRIFEEGDATTYDVGGLLCLVSAVGGVARGYLEGDRVRTLLALGALRGASMRLADAPDPTFADALQG